MQTERLGWKVKKKRILVIVSAVLAIVILTAVGFRIWLPYADFGFSREIGEAERALRLQVVQTAQGWLGSKEGSDGHKEILHIYNTHTPLAQGYAVQEDDSWCATFGSTVAIQCGLTKIIPTECSCERQIGLFRDMGDWEEKDDYVPLPGDYIFYTLKNPSMGDSTAWSDHVGIVVGTWNGFIKVIEGNNANTVKYRILPVDDPRIRGFGLPDYQTETAS